MKSSFILLCSLISVFIFQSCATKEKTKNQNNDIGLSKEQISDTIKENIKDITICYEIGLNENSKLSGRFVISFIVNIQGQVKSASVVESTLGSKVTEDCAVSKFLSWQFPAPLGGVDVSVKYPFKLEKK